MEIKEISSQEYTLLKNYNNVFNSAMFCELNKSKVNELIYLCICKEKKPRFALAIGICNDVAKCPFSAPFAYPETIKKKMSLENYEEAIEAIEEYFKRKRIKEAIINFPPIFYDEEVISAWLNVLLRRGWSVDWVDISYSIFLKNQSLNDYMSSMDTNGRRNLKIADKQELSLRLCKNDDDIKLGYEIIEKNRNYKGYPLRMSLVQVMDTMQVVKSQMYIVESEGIGIAAALVYEINEKVAQLIYWGDIPGVTEKKSINFLARELFVIYRNRGYDYLDIGPSTEEGIPNYGLCAFKESIGCKRDLKFRMKKDY